MALGGPTLIDFLFASLLDRLLDSLWLIADFLPSLVLHKRCAGNSYFCCLHSRHFARIVSGYLVWVGVSLSKTSFAGSNLVWSCGSAFDGALMACLETSADDITGFGYACGI